STARLVVTRFNCTRRSQARRMAESVQAFRRRPHCRSVLKLTDALPSALKKQLAAGKDDLHDPATTTALPHVNASACVAAFATPDGSVKGMGIQCAFCHSTVDNSFAASIGKRLDGWPNRDLNVGAIVSLAPNLKPFTDLLGVDASTVRKVLASWGPGRFDAE